MSPRAAWRLETLGFTRVYDYVPGKSDWFGAGLPREGTAAATPRAGDVAERDAVECRLEETVGDVVRRMQAAGREECLVVTEQNVVLGRLRAAAAATGPERRVAEAMEAGPTTIRPDTELREIAERLRRRGVPRIVVSRSDGTLVGTLRVEAADRRLADDDAACLCDD